MKDLLIYVVVANYGQYDDATSNTEYVGTSKEKAIETIKTVEGCGFGGDWGCDYRSSHIEVWNDGMQIQCLDDKGEITWVLDEKVKIPHREGTKMGSKKTTKKKSTNTSKKYLLIKTI